MALPNKSLPDPAIQRNFLELDKRLSIQGLLGGGGFSGALGAGIPVLYTATPSASSPTTTSTADPMTAVIPQMTITEDFGGDPVIVFFSASFSNNSAANFTRVELYDAGTRVDAGQTVRATNGISPDLTIAHAYTPAAGSRTLDIRWNTSAGTATATLLRRSLVIARLKR